MFTLKPIHEDKLNDAIAAALDTLNAEEQDSQLYNEALAHLEKLYAFRAQSAMKPVDPNTVLGVAGNLAGVLLIIKYEQINVITSKALSFIKLK
jgi:hypothetical protein